MCVPKVTVNQLTSLLENAQIIPKQSKKQMAQAQGQQPVAAAEADPKIIELRQTIMHGLKASEFELAAEFAASKLDDATEVLMRTDVKKRRFDIIQDRA